MSYPYQENQSNPTGNSQSNHSIWKYLPAIGVILLVLIIWRSYQQQQQNAAITANQIEMQGAMRANVRNNIASYIQARLY